MILMNAVDSRGIPLSDTQIIFYLVFISILLFLDNYATHRDSKYRSPGFVQAYVKTYKDANFKWGVRFSKAG